MDVHEVPVHIARTKAAAVTKETRLKDKLILAADTIVVIDNEVIGKPENREHAINILQRLSNRQHEVITGVVLQYNDEEIAFADVTICNISPHQQGNRLNGMLINTSRMIKPAHMPYRNGLELWA